MGTLFDKALERISDDPDAAQLIKSLSGNDDDTEDHMLWLLDKSGINLPDFRSLSVEKRYAALCGVVIDLLSPETEDMPDDNYAVDTTDGSVYNKAVVDKRIEQIVAADPVSLCLPGALVLLKDLTPQEKRPAIEAMAERIRTAGLRVPDFILNA